jgi:integrase/recombinase XerD
MRRPVVPILESSFRCCVSGGGAPCIETPEIPSCESSKSGAMLETHLHSSMTRQRLRKGPAAGHVDSFADWLRHQGYRSVSMKHLLTALAGWTDWMVSAGFTGRDILPGYDACKVEISKPLRIHYRGGPTRKSLTAASIFLRFLRERGELPPLKGPPSVTDRWPILTDFRSWMRTHRGLTESTLDVYEGILVGLVEAVGDDTTGYSAETLRSFVLEQGIQQRYEGLRGGRAEPMCMDLGNRPTPL